MTVCGGSCCGKLKMRNQQVATKGQNEGMPVAFARRTAWDLTESPSSRALHQRRLAGLPVDDLTVSNPTQAGFSYDPAIVLPPLASPGVLAYDPDPRGMLAARQAVCAYYADAGAALNPEQILLTTSTSEAYSFLFRLLCNPGDEVLLAQPSYPLFDFLAQIDDVRLTAFPLFYDHGWQMDRQGLEERITPRTRAIALVHPNNPTGHFTSQAERAALEQLCAAHGLALIVDEVFLDYALPGAGPAPGSFAAGEHPVLTFILSGLSKIAALPQMKAAWIAACGPSGEVQEALSRLEVIADTFLSMNAPIQHALPHWLSTRQWLQQQVRERVQANLDALDAALAAQSLVSRLSVQAGWYAVLRVPALQSDEDLTIGLLQQAGVYVHPGHFFGFSGSGWLIVSLLTPLEVFHSGVQAICRIIKEIDSSI
jgi:aspartate/methionine/tyrosine aminotransferase